MKNKFLLFVNDYVNFWFKGLIPEKPLKTSLVLFFGLFLPEFLFVGGVVIIIYRFIKIMFKEV